MNQNRFLESLGWVGVASILLAYALHTFGVLDTGLWYQMLNLAGALGIVVSSIDNKNYQPIILNLIWAGIAVVGIVNSLF
jgi:hypothetical protein